MKNTFLTLIVFIFSLTIFSQTPAKYWVKFKVKDPSNYSINKPEAFLSPTAIEKRKKLNIPITEQDFPVAKKLINTVLKIDPTARFILASKWLNGATFYSENPDFVTIMKECDLVDYVERTAICKEVEPIIKGNTTFFNSSTPVVKIPNDIDYGIGTVQIKINNIHWLHRMGFKGEGVLMQVQDGGFLNSDQIRHFRQHFTDNRVRGVKNFVQPEKSTFRDGSHGTGVWSCMAAYIPGELVGSAPACNFYLVQTEDNRSEFTIEEDYWVAGLEFADSLGVDVINSSLNYTKFDDTTYYRTYETLNGKSSRASLAADIAVSKGIVVVNSAGNEGRGKWHYIGCPAEANFILATGAVDSLGRKAPFSSFGPTFDKRIKPDGAAVGWNTWVGLENDNTTFGSGTSYAAPMLAGMVACLRQAFPTKTSYQIIDAVRKSGSQYSAPDTALGYGLTDFLKAFNLLLQPTKPTLLCTFDSYVVNHTNNFTFSILTTKESKVSIKYSLRTNGKEKTKTQLLSVGENSIEILIDKLPHNKKFDFVDLFVTEGKTEHHFVLGRE